MVLNLSNNVGGNINKPDIRDIYRVRGKKEGPQNTPIIVETSSTLLKTDILKMSKNFNVKHKTKLRALHLGFRTSEDTPIYVSEQLTARGSRLHFLARDLAKSKQYKFCWTAYGKVYVRKAENTPIIAIKTEAQVQQLLLEQ
ncbi:Zinc finger DNA binding protein [Operophtera brumata]|nr:Zinc finger DNA binding protein [Operophtera brumata]